MDLKALEKSENTSSESLYELATIADEFSKAENDLKVSQNKDSLSEADSSKLLWERSRLDDKARAWARFEI